MKDKDVKIFIATHKKFDMPEGIDRTVYLPFQVGIGDDLGYMRENNRNNIAEKNANFCELTLLYYIWKNIYSDIIGLVHYRRYLFKKNKFKKIGPFYIPCKRYYTILDRKDILSILNKYDVILPRVNNIFEKSIKEQYGLTHHIDDWNIISEIVSEKYPEYIGDFRIIEDGKNFMAAICLLQRRRSLPLILNGFLIYCLKLKKDVISQIIQIIKSVFLVSYLKGYLQFGFTIIEALLRFLKQK